MKIEKDIGIIPYRLISGVETDIEKKTVSISLMTKEGPVEKTFGFDEIEHIVIDTGVLKLISLASYIETAMSALYVEKIKDVQKNIKTKKS